MDFYTAYDLLVENKQSGYKPDKLPFDYDALEPYITEETMNLHYNKHYKTYIRNLNEAITTTKPIQELVKEISKYSNRVRNNAGGYYNHSLFWKMLCPESKLEGQIKDRLIQQFKSVDNFKEKFIETAIGCIGSSWTWLIERNGKLEIYRTENQDNPLMFYKNCKILFGLDMYEHSYYLFRQDNKRGYAQDVVNHLINWKYVNSILTAS